MGGTVIVNEGGINYIKTKILPAFFNKLLSGCHQQTRKDQIHDENKSSWREVKYLGVWAQIGWISDVCIVCDPSNVSVSQQPERHLSSRVLLEPTATNNNKLTTHTYTAVCLLLLLLCLLLLTKSSSQNKWKCLYDHRFKIPTRTY